jgi:hypothetical protein
MVEKDFAAERKRPKGGNQPKNVHRLRAQLAKALGGMPLSKQGLLGAYVQNMCAVLHLHGYCAKTVAASPELQTVLATQLRKDFDRIVELKIGKTAIAERAHLWTVPQIEQMVTSAQRYFQREGKRSCAQGMIDAVMRGAHPSMDALIEAHAELEKKAQANFGKDPATARVMRSAISIALKRPSRTLDSSHERYTTALACGEQIAKQDREFAPVVRTMAGFVMDGRFASMHEAHRRYTEVRLTVEKSFARWKTGKDFVRSATLLILKGQYASPLEVRRGWNACHKNMLVEAKRDVRLKPAARTLAGLLLAGSYKSPKVIADKYLTALDEATQLFGKNRFGRTFARNAASLVVQKRFGSALKVWERYQQLCKDADREIPHLPEASAVRGSLITVVLRGECDSLRTALQLFESSLSVVKQTKAATRSGKMGAHAIQALRARKKLAREQGAN